MVSKSVDTDMELIARAALAGPSGPFNLEISTKIEAGSFVALVGPSGAGKTTLLRITAGLARPDHGLVRVGSQIWHDTASGIDVPVRKRSIGFVFQDYALFPNMTVRRNVEYAIGSRSQSDEVQRLLELVALEGLADAFPARLSGGQRQRLALIRALARRPAILMLDEPLSALDPTMRRQLQDELKRLHRSFGTTSILVSHDISEILRLADRVIRLEHGRVTFDGDPACAFGMAEEKGGIRLMGEHVSGPDEDGFSTVHLDGRLCRVRYRNLISPSVGDAVMIHFDEVEIQKPSIAVSF